MSKGDTKSPVHFPGGKGVNNPARDAGLSDLAQLARQAFEEKRRKQCLMLTNAILKIDPENKEASVLQSWAREDLTRDLSNAKRQVEEARLDDDLGLWDRAERLVREILSVDLDNEEAKTLLAEVIAAQNAWVSAHRQEIADEAHDTPFAVRESWIKFWIKPKTVGVVVLSVVVLAALIVFFVVPRIKGGPEGQANAESGERDTSTGPEAAAATSGMGSYELFVVPVQGVRLSVDGAPPIPVPQKIELPAGPHRLVFSSEGYASKEFSETLDAGATRALPVMLELASGDLPAKNEPAKAVSTKPTPKSATVARPPVAASEARGSLAISAAVPVTVFHGGKDLGTTPLMVQLPIGRQTLEYRYEGFRQAIAHQIKAGETTAATITFDLNLQINARPWAVVSIEGPQGRTLGQTPLGDVSVTAGSVLVFQNPNFPTKRYRVTGRDTAIQILFP